VTLGLGAAGRVLVVVFSWRGRDIRIISARPADATSGMSTKHSYERPIRFQKMVNADEFYHPEPEPEGKTRITIRLDQDVVDRFFAMAEQTGGTTGYQTLINAALREYLDGRLQDSKIPCDASSVRN